MSVPADAVDWTRAVRDERHRQWWGLPFLVAFFGGTALLQGGSPFGSGRLGWVLVTAYLVLTGAIIAVGRLRPQARRRSAAALRAQVALRLHADPGPDARGAADRIARSIGTGSWIAWGFVVVPLSLVSGGRWDSPLPAASGTILVVAASAAGHRVWRGRVADARRWLADPPGPRREPPPLTRLERWTNGRWLRWAGPVAAAMVLAGIGVGLLAAWLE